MESKTTRNKKEEKAVKVCLCEFFFCFVRSVQSTLLRSQ